MVARDEGALPTNDKQLEKLQDEAYTSLAKTVDEFQKLIEYLDVNPELRQRGKAMRAICTLRQLYFDRHSII